MAAQKKTVGNHGVYTAGSAAVRTAQPERVEINEKEYLAQAGRRIEEKVRINQKAGKEFSPVQAAILAAAAAVILVLSVMYIMQLSNYYTLKSSIASLEYTLETTVQSNSMTEEEIEQNLDLPAIYTYATTVLGMSLPEKNQVVYYEQNAEEYVSVNGEIPNE